MSGSHEGAVTADAWSRLRGMTPARIALGRAGPSLPTREVLHFALAHARARDAVHAPFDVDAVAAAIADLGLATARVHSAAPSRAVYLHRPDLGRRLSPESRDALAARDAAPVDLVVIVAD